MNEIMKSHNPATLELIDEIKPTKPEELPDIIEKAREVQQKWGMTPIKSRIKHLKNLQNYISEHIEEIGKIIHQETGKPKIEAINSDILAGMASLRYSIDMIEEIAEPSKIKFKGMRIPMWYMGRKSYIYPKPIGVVGIISPWNFPFGIPFTQVITAIAVGNAVILKPSSDTPLTGLKIGEIIKDAGLPHHLVQIIPGSGSELGSAMTKSKIDRIIFTGSVAIGKKIMEMASQRLTPVTLELGGKSPMIVLKDADLERTVQGAVWGSFVNSGQVCAGIKRIYVHNTLFGEFIEDFKYETEKLKQGWNWNDPEISIGPLINEDALHGMQNHVKTAVEQGAKILTGGKRNEDFKGYFFQPTILIDVTQDMDAVQEEIFGPIVVVLPFGEIHEAIDMANDTKFGLFGSVWTNNVDKGKEIAKKLTMGTVAVNNHVYTYGLPHTPWGGNKNSGFGRTHGKFGFEEVMEPHHIHVDEERIKKDPWWYPYNEDKLKMQYDIRDTLFLKKPFKYFSLMKKLKK